MAENLNMSNLFPLNYQYIFEFKCTFQSSLQAYVLFSNFEKLKLYDFFKQTVSYSTSQEYKTEKEQKENLDWCLCGKS